MRRHQLGSTSLGVVLVQALVLALIGAAIGLADSRIRPIKLGIETRPGPDTGPAASDPPPGEPTASGNQPVAAPGGAGTEPTVVATPAEQPPQAAAPAGGAAKPFRPTTKEELKGKPGHITLEEGFEMHQFMGAVFLDARNAEEFASGHVEGAHRAGLDRFRSGDVPQVLLELPKEALIVVYCSGGHDCEASEDVASHLNGQGFFNVRVLHDGIVGWQAMKYPVAVGGGQ